MPLRISLILLVLLAACRDDESVRAYGGADKEWRLIELNDQPFEAKVTLTFPEAGRIAGNAPCNSYNGSMTVPYPWFEAGAIAATKRACPDLAAESSFFTALEETVAPLEARFDQKASEA